LKEDSLRRPADDSQKRDGSYLALRKKQKKSRLHTCGDRQAVAVYTFIAAEEAALGASGEATIL
jgi:hypothetical protein